MAGIVRTSKTCRRCGSPDVCIICRSDDMCRDCYLFFVQTKVIKRLDAFRTRSADGGVPRKVALALSMGEASLAMLNVLDKHVARQMSRTGRVGFELHVLHAYDSESTVSAEKTSSSLEAIKEYYPQHTFYDVDVRSWLSETRDDSPAHDVAQYADAALSPSSQSDIARIFLRRTIQWKAHDIGCSTVFWGDSTTRLAERVLAETAKGRGHSLPALLDDNEKSANANAIFPMQDLFRGELLSYIQLHSPSISFLVLEQNPEKVASTSKSQTIDGLMREYFESAEMNYPSIVANVVKTSAKLNQLPQTSDSQGCPLCGTIVGLDSFGLSNWGGAQSQAGHDLGDEQPATLCYGCARCVVPTKP